jgi:hypothetical protein
MADVLEVQDLLSNHQLCKRLTDIRPEGITGIDRPYLTVREVP